MTDNFSKSLTSITTKPKSSKRNIKQEKQWKNNKIRNITFKRLYIKIERKV
jgi:hypothetical protein